jgi:hypothetical protein
VRSDKEEFIRYAIRAMLVRAMLLEEERAKEFRVLG